MNFFDFCLAHTLLTLKDFLILKKHKALNLRFLKRRHFIKGLSQGFYNSLRKLDFSSLEKDFKKAKRFKLLRVDSKNYPLLLKQIPDSPVYLFVWGNIKILNSHSLSIVGSRRATEYGKRVVNFLVSNLKYNWIIVSGLAIGIDGFAHKAALDFSKKTIAVLGSGFFNIYPSVHEGLAHKIIKEGGALVSEYPPSFKPERYFFPSRNRIIAGLSLATIIIEAGKHSGALITSSFAARYGREVMVVPANIFSLTSEGCFSLIKDGAKPIFKAEDIEEEFRFLDDFKEKVEKKEPLFDFLKIPRHLEEIKKFLNLNSSETLKKLSQLEVENKIKDLGGGLFQAI